MTGWEYEGEETPPTNLSGSADPHEAINVLQSLIPSDDDVMRAGVMLGNLEDAPGTHGVVLVGITAQQALAIIANDPDTIQALRSTLLGAMEEGAKNVSQMIGDPEFDIKTEALLESFKLIEDYDELRQRMDEDGETW
jgi:hypothetical protein